MKSVIKYLLSALIVAAVSMACGEDKGTDSLADSFDVQFVLPSLADVAQGGKLVLAVTDGKAPKSTDSFILESASGISYVCSITDPSSERFTVNLNNECGTGYYNAFVKRDTRKKAFGKIYINIVEEIADFTPDEGTTIYGVVSTAQGVVPNVVVSDGDQVVVTDQDGIYQLKSTKKWGYVFITIPSGYEVPSDGVLPLFYYNLKGAAGSIERVDFSLTKVDNQDTYKVFMLGDMHLANRTNDSNQFIEFMTDLKDYMNQHKGKKMYAITLGDMTWDLYWYTNNYYFPQYLNAVNSKLQGLQIFHTMGNHDNEYTATSDYTAAVKYVGNIAPTYYSFNIGKVHYVVLDDIDCDSYDGTTSRNYSKRVSSEQLAWLAKDLSYVDKSTPIVVATHAQIFYPSTTTEFKIDHDQANTQSLFNVLDGYTVHFVTGHTHHTFNVTPDAAIVGGRDFYEHNSGSVCGSWWWSGYLTPGVHLSPDGTPGGYAVWDVSGTDLKWFYKSTGWPEDYQFRTYDLNNVSFTTDDVPLMTSNTTVRNAYQKYVTAYPANNNNEVLINIWNWNSNWSLSVVDENSNVLTPSAVWAYDPLHVAALTVKRFNSATITAAPNFITASFVHFFKVKAANADVDLTITVQDEFGNTWVEDMERPKAFSIDAYKQ